MSFRKLRVLALSAALSAAGTAPASTPLDVYFGDGGTSAFYRWDGTVVRLVTAWNTDAGDVDRMIADARELGVVTHRK